MPLTKNCLSCKSEFLTYPSKIKNGRGKYCSVKCANRSFVGKRFSKKTEFKKGIKPWNAKGWRYAVSRKGGNKYILLHRPDHPDSDNRGYIRKHRLVAEEKIGRRLKKSEIVHHKDGDTLNNEPNNLQVMKKKEHDKMNVVLNVHRRWVERGGGFYSRT